MAEDTMIPCTESRLDLLRALHTPPDTSIKDPEYKDTLYPLWALLTIYEKANTECYVNYMEGFKLLLDWLSPIAYPRHTRMEYYNKSSILYGYESAELARILNIPQPILIKCIIERVLPKL